MDDLTAEMMEMEDKKVLIDEIMKEYGQEILQLVYSYVNDRQTAEDLTQDIFVKCYQSLHTYKAKSKLKTWLWRIAINQCKDYLKSWYSRKVTVMEKYEDRGIPNQSAEQMVIQQVEDERLASCVMNLPVPYREVIYLFYFEDMPIKDIAAVLRQKENTVKTRLRRAKELLKDGWEA